MNKIYFLLLALVNLAIPAAQAQLITCYAGSGSHSYSGDGGPATAAGINPANICTDTAGNLYIVESYMPRIRKVTPAGIVTTIAGTGTYGYSGDGGPATAAAIGNPIYGITATRDGSIYFTNNFDSMKIRKIDPSGIITTIAGNGLHDVAHAGLGVYSGDGGPASAAGFYNLGNLATDTADNIYVAETGRIRRIDKSGIITTVAGNGTYGLAGDGGPAKAAELIMSGLSLDTSGNIYISGKYSVRRIDKAGIITTIAGTGVYGYSGDGGPATAAVMSLVYAVTADRRGNIYVGDIENYRVRRIDAAGIITTVAGNGIQGYKGDGDVCAATTSEVYGPQSMTVDIHNNIYIVDTYKVRKLSDNAHPAFGTRRISAGACKDGVAVALGPLLGITDGEPGQTEDWSIITAPVHGTAAGTYSGTYGGGTLLPSGLTYTPTAGYLGTDSFAVRVADCIDSADTAMVYVTIDTLPVAGTITGTDTVCKGATVTLLAGVAGGVWSSATGNATVTAGVMRGVTPGADTIRYTVTNSCSSVAAQLAVTVVHCPDAVTEAGNAAAALQVATGAAGSCTVLLTGPAQPYTLTATDMAGRVVYRSAATAGTPLPLQLHQPAGIYVLTAHTAAGDYRVKVAVRP